MVAETIMKKLFNRNKELETYHSDQIKKAKETSEQTNFLPMPSEELGKLMDDFKVRET